MKEFRIVYKNQYNITIDKDIKTNDIQKYLKDNKIKQDDVIIIWMYE